MSVRYETLLDQLAAELTPRQPLRDGRVVGGLAVLVVLGWVLVSALLGPRADLMAGQPSGILVLRSVMLLGLGGLCAAAALRMARPVVGLHFGWAWQAGLLMALSLPLAGALEAFGDRAELLRVAGSASGLVCMGVSFVAGLGMAAVIVMQLRRGAPVVPERAALVTGLASGSFGTLIYSVHCPWDSLVYIGLWYSLAIGLVTLVCRLVVPRLIRW